MKSLRFVCLLTIFISTIALAQKNPIPLVNQPLVPESAKPGSAGFTLTVNGTGFSSGAVVNWNGTPRTTEVISSSQLKATISATDVAKVGTASVTVVNPAPGGGTSSAVYFPIRQRLSSVALAPVPTAIGYGVIAVGDFNNDGKLDVVSAQVNNADWVISLFRGKGDGTFKKPIQTVISVGDGGDIDQVNAVGLSKDGKLDLAVFWTYGGDTGTDILLNNGDGTFRQSNQNLPGIATFGDLNGDGVLDAIAVGAGYEAGSAFVMLGDGKGGFKQGEQLNVDGGFLPAAIGDFNGDGKLDLAMPAQYGGVTIFLGNGDGTFPENGVVYSTKYGGSLVAADVNGDGKLDLIDSGCVLLGNGDGTFTQGSCTSSPFSLITVGDFNGDGKLDLAGVYYNLDGNNSATLMIALGNGDGTFQLPIEVADGFLNIDFALPGVGFGDFNGDGKLDLIAPALAGTPVFLQTLASVTPNAIAFGSQGVGTKSAPQTVVLKNIDTSGLTISGITIVGADAQDFTQTNKCGTSLPPGRSCQIHVTFAPKRVADLTASVQVNYQGGPQLVSLTGTGVSAATASLTPSKLTFPLQLVGTTSGAQPATLKNTGSTTVTISNISATAPFSETNNCPGSLTEGQSCDIQVSFAPTAKGSGSGQLSVTDNATGSPQTVALSGTGTVVELSPIGVTFGDQKVGTKSAPVPVKLTNVAKTSLSVSQITISGADEKDFSQTNNCGSSVPAGGSCTIKVVFKPTATGQRSANLTIRDDGGGSPQAVTLFGTGT
jgi:hypothetical protein